MSLYTIRFSKGHMTAFLPFLKFLFLHSAPRQGNGIYRSLRDHYLLPPEAVENIIYAYLNYSKHFSSRTDMARIPSLGGKWPIWAKFRNHKKLLHSTTFCHGLFHQKQRCRGLWFFFGVCSTQPRFCFFWTYQRHRRHNLNRPINSPDGVDRLINQYPTYV